jgi:nicotinamide riboside transporter PnuC
MKYYGLDWIGTVLGLMSIYYLGRKRKIGFILRIVASVFWVAFGIVAGTTAGIVANVAVILLSVSGLRQWKREDAGPILQSAGIKVPALSDVAKKMEAP